MISMIYSSPTCKFNLYRYTQSAKRIAKSDLSRQETEVEFAKCQIPLYVKTGIKSFDQSIITGKKHPRFKSVLESKIKRYMIDTLALLSNSEKHLNNEPSVDYRIAESTLDHFFDSLQYYTKLRDRPKPKRKMKMLTSDEQEYILWAEDLFCSLGGYWVVTI